MFKRLQQNFIMVYSLDYCNRMGMQWNHSS